MKRSIILRVIATFLAVIGWRVMNVLLNAGSTIVSAELAGKQFDNSNVSYGISRFAQFFTGEGLPAILFVVVLAIIWWKYVKQGWTALTSAAMIGIVLLGAVPVRAYYAQTDYAETYFILPNESAFFIPDVGANKDSQVKFGSKEYLAENKIPAKRFSIPHTQLSNSSVWRNYFVPSGRLIIVDRAPYSRHWVDAQGGRGTSESDQSIHCQSMDGLDIKVGIALGVTVHEDDSPNYLYNFGIIPPEGDRTVPEVIFTSVFHARTLSDVMDTFGFTETQAAICAETTKRLFEDVNKEAGQIIDNVEKNIEKRFKEVGITMSFFGWGDTFHFSDKVQDALDSRYVASILEPHIHTLQALADIQVKTGLATGMAKRLPSTLLMPPDMLNALVGAAVVSPKNAAVPVPGIVPGRQNQ
ncbi:MAG: hypothetical protein AAB691_04260 [Patescibacteria group bacterium]